MRSASGAAPMTPSPGALPRPAASEATIVPWSGASEPTGRVPSAEPTPERSMPSTTAPRRSGCVASTPESMIAIVTPAPRVTAHAARIPYSSSQY